MDVIKLQDEWTVVEQVGGGGFGRVYRVASGGEERALKLVPKSPGAERELLFVDLTNAVNIIPVLETGEAEGEWAILMPMAEHSLRDTLVSDDCLDLSDVTKVLLDVAKALESLSGDIVHRDIKPENVLWFQGAWCLADFGIARYVEATTDPATRKFALTPAYSAPERWRMERATPAADIYSLGVTAYELLEGSPPFPGLRPPS